MTPEQLKMLEDLWQWMQERKTQQLFLPVDDASRAALRALMSGGLGNSAVTESLVVGAGGGTFTVAKKPSGSLFVEVDGQLFEIPYL